MSLRSRSTFVPVFAALVGVLTLAQTARAGAPVPTCKGHDAAAAATAKSEGLKHYRQSKRKGATDADMTAALAFFDAACAAGDDYVLELRAYALAGVERYVEAAETLDAFLAAHPLASLPSDTQARVAAQEPEILARVASLSVDSEPQGADVSVNHRPVGPTPLVHLRLDPGRYDVSVGTPDGKTQGRTVDLPAGETRESFALDAPKVVAEPVVTLPAPSVAPDHKSLRPWIIATGVVAGAFLVEGIGTAAWATERTNTYNSANCNGSSKPGCTDTLSQFHTARDLEIAGFVVAGVAAAAAATLVYLEVRSTPPRAAPEAVGGLRCGLGPTAVSCSLGF